MTIKSKLRVTEIVLEFVPAEGDFEVPEVAARALKHLRSEWADLYREWLDDMAQTTIARQLTEALNANRAAARRQALLNTAAVRVNKKRAVQEAVVHEIVPLSPVAMNLYTGMFAVEHSVVIYGTKMRRRLGDMTKSDLLSVAGDYAFSAKKSQLEARFYRSLAKITPPGKKLSEVLSVEEAESRYRTAVDVPVS